jgi:hypothetical protein
MAEAAIITVTTAPLQVQTRLKAQLIALGAVPDKQEKRPIVFNQRHSGGDGSLLGQ